VHAGGEGVLRMKTFEMPLAALGAKLKVDVAGDTKRISEVYLQVYMGKFAGVLLLI
jgi:hypothetical protein